MLSFQKHANPDEPNENIGVKLAFHLRKGIIKIADRARHMKAITRDCSQSVQIKISFQSPTFDLWIHRQGHRSVIMWHEMKISDTLNHGSHFDGQPQSIWMPDAAEITTFENSADVVQVFQAGATEATVS